MTDNQFKAGDEAMAIDSGKLYEVKVLKAQNLNGVTKYFIHFQGWNKRWDKWVDASGLTEKTEDMEIKANGIALPTEQSSQTSTETKKPAKVISCYSHYCSLY